MFVNVIHVPSLKSTMNKSRKSFIYLCTYLEHLKVNELSNLESEETLYLNLSNKLVSLEWMHWELEIKLKFGSPQWIAIILPIMRLQSLQHILYHPLLCTTSTNLFPPPFCSLGRAIQKDIMRVQCLQRFLHHPLLSTAGVDLYCCPPPSSFRTCH